MHTNLQARRVTSISKTVIGQTLTIENTYTITFTCDIRYILTETCDKL